MKKQFQLLLIVVAFITAQRTHAQTCTAQPGPNKTICCPGGSVVLGDGGASASSTCPCGSFTYSWSPSIGLSNPAVSSPTAFPSITTVYTLCITSFSGHSCVNTCCMDCKTVTVTVSNVCCRLMNPGTTPGRHAEAITFFPNPAHNVITVEVSKPIVDNELTLTDLMGHVILKKTLKDTKISADIDVSNLSKGVYFIKATGKDGEPYFSKIVLE